MSDKPGTNDIDDGIYSRAPAGSISVPAELVNFKKTTTSTDFRWLVNSEDIGFKLVDWQSDPTRIIYYGGKYHMWMIDTPVDWGIKSSGTVEDNLRLRLEPPERLKQGFSRILYMTSDDTHHWSAVGYVPLGPRGSCYDLDLEQANVVYYEGKFYLFTEGFTTNVEKYGQRRAGITCLVAASPEGPWEQPPGVDLLVGPEMDAGGSWDSMHVNNPRHILLDGRWYMYYKGRRRLGSPTDNGVAIAESILGPYKKYGGNPIMKGHGQFCWGYKHGVLMIPHHQNWIHWSEDGIHFAPVANDPNIFRFGALYVPGDPLFGEPAGVEPSTRYWGFETIDKTRPGNQRPDPDVEGIEFEFGSDS